MPIVKDSQSVMSPEAKWWAAVHQHAVQLERLITSDPAQIPVDERGDVVTALETIAHALDAVPHTRTTSDVHETLGRAVNYLGLCYEELARDNAEESRFYYNSALVQVTQLHQFLVEHHLID